MIEQNDRGENSKQDLEKMKLVLEGTKQRDFFVCKFCHSKIAKTYLGQHLILKHGDRVYDHYVIVEQSQIEEFSGEKN